jgi:hypothetical protein
MDNYVMYDNSDNYIYLDETMLVIMFLDNAYDDEFRDHMKGMKGALQVFKTSNNIRRLSIEIYIEEHDDAKLIYVNRKVTAALAHPNCNIEYLGLDIDWMYNDPYTDLENAIIAKRLKHLVLKSNPLILNMILPVCTALHNQLETLQTLIIDNRSDQNSLWYNILTHPNNRIRKLIIQHHTCGGISRLREALAHPNCKIRYITLKYHEMRSDELKQIIAGINNPVSRIEFFNIDLDTVLINDIEDIKSLNNVCLQQFGPIKLERNIIIQNAITQAARTLIAIRKFRFNEAGLFGLIPKEIIRLIAEYLLSTYREQVWLAISPTIIN